MKLLNERNLEYYIVTLSLLIHIHSRIIHFYIIDVSYYDYHGTKIVHCCAYRLYDDLHRLKEQRYAFDQLRNLTD